MQLNDRINSINTENDEVLNKGLEHAIFRYKEELEKYHKYNKRAMYPLTVITFLITVLSVLPQKSFLPSIDSFCTPILFFSVLVVLVCFIGITTPYFYKKYISIDFDAFANRCSDDVQQFKKYLICIYLTDAASYQKLNKYRGLFLFIMNICLVISIACFFAPFLNGIIQNIVTKFVLR